MSKEVMRQALEALQEVYFGSRSAKHDEAITALREALAEQPAQQEPVAWPCLIAEADFSQDTVTLAMQCTDYKVSAGKHWLSNTPPAQRTWVGLTDEEITDIWAEASPYYHEDDFARAIEAKLKEKNT